jgi:hypothetical protein
MEESKPEKMLPTRSICARYDVTSRTIDRWLQAGVLPLPIRIRNRRYWRESDLVQSERKGMSTHKSTEPGGAA